MLIQSNVVLEFDIPNKKYRIKDTTNYLSLYGLNVGTVGPRILGTIYFNGAVNQQHNMPLDPLINLATGNTSLWYNLPLDSNGNIVNGTWTATVSMYVIYLNGQISNVASPVVLTDGDNWLYYFLEGGDTIALVYGAGTNNITVGGFLDQNPDVEITATSAIPAETYTAWQIEETHLSGSLSHTYKGCIEVVPCIETTYDCDSTVTGTITANDATVYGTQSIVDSELQLIPPAWAQQTYNAQTTSETGTSPLSITATQLYEGPWTAMLESDVTYTQNDGLIVLYTITANVIVDVNCSGTLCKFTKCIDKLRKQVYADMKAMGSSVYEKYLLNVLSYVQQAMIYKSCGDTDKYKQMLELIDAELNASGLECDCDCNDEGFRRILNVPESITNAITQLEANYQYIIENLQWVPFNGVPGPAQDEANGFFLHQILLNYNTGTAYIATDVTDGAAVWTVYNDPSVAQVFDNLVAQGIDATTTAILQYGVNVFRTITNTDYCCKLPQPLTGRRATVINMTTSNLVVYPSNIGGQINNLPIDTPLVLPPDGIPHDFVCIENPLPGAWSVSAPATTQYDSGEITVNVTGVNKVIMAANDSNKIERTSGFYSSTSWSYLGLNNPLIQSFPATFVAFKEAAPWLGITKVKVYTNLSATGANVEFRLTASNSFTDYDSVTGAPISFGSSNAGDYALSGSCNQEINGGSIPFGTLTANIGDAGTCWGELVITGTTLNEGGIIGDVLLSQIPAVPNPLNQYYNGYVGFNIKPQQVLSGFKFRFFIEHY